MTSDISLSELLYKYLDRNVKLSKNISDDISKLVKGKTEEIVECIHQQDARFERKPKATGSYYQGLKVSAANEFDFNVNLSGFDDSGWDRGYCTSGYYRLIRDDKNHESLLDMDNLDTLPSDMELVTSKDALQLPAGYYFITAPRSWMYCSDLVYKGDVIPFYALRTFKKLLHKAVKETTEFKGEVQLRRKVHGPALTLTLPIEDNEIPEVNIDLAVSIPTHLPIPDTVKWPRPHAKWPSQEKIDAVSNAGMTFVAKHPYYWYMSYSNCEQELITKIDESGGCRKPCHRIMKSFRENYWCKLKSGSNEKPVLSSYHLKNLLFWECERYPNDHQWTRDRIWERFESMTNELVQYIEMRHFPHYFNMKLDLFQGKDWQVLDTEKQRIQNFMKNARFILIEALAQIPHTN